MPLPTSPNPDRPRDPAASLLDYQLRIFFTKDALISDRVDALRALLHIAQDNPRLFSEEHVDLLWQELTSPDHRAELRPLSVQLTISLSFEKRDLQERIIQYVDELPSSGHLKLCLLDLSQEDCGPAIRALKEGDPATRRRYFDLLVRTAIRDPQVAIPFLASIVSVNERDPLHSFSSLIQELSDNEKLRAVCMESLNESRQVDSTLATGDALLLGSLWPEAVGRVFEDEPVEGPLTALTFGRDPSRPRISAEIIDELIAQLTRHKQTPSTYLANLYTGNNRSIVILAVQDHFTSSLTELLRSLVTEEVITHIAIDLPPSELPILMNALEAPSEANCKKWLALPSDDYAWRSHEGRMLLLSILSFSTQPPLIFFGHPAPEGLSTKALGRLSEEASAGHLLDGLAQHKNPRVLVLGNDVTCSKVPEEGADISLYQALSERLYGTARLKTIAFRAREQFIELAWQQVWDALPPESFAIDCTWPPLSTLDADSYGPETEGAGFGTHYDGLIVARAEDASV